VRRLEVRSPFDGKTIGIAPDFDADVLIESFEDALGALHALPHGQIIQEKLRNWARKIYLQREQLARIVSLETGKPIRFARVEVLTALTVLDSRCDGAASPVTAPDFPYIKLVRSGPDNGSGGGGRAPLGSSACHQAFFARISCFLGAGISLEHR
jgi:hypothetical protein